MLPRSPVIVVRGSELDSSQYMERAVRTGCVSFVRELITSYGLKRWRNGYPLLVEALWCGRIEVAKCLLENGCEVNREKDDSPLHVAVSKHLIEIVKILLEKGAHVNACNDDGETPLHIAARKKDVELTALLVESGAHVNVPNDEGKNPIMLSLKRGRFQIAECLIKHGADVNSSKSSKGYRPIHLAVKKANEKMVNILLGEGALVNAIGKGKTPLHIAAHVGYYPVVKLLLKHGADIHCKCTGNVSKDYTALHFAAENGSDDIVKFLLNDGAKVNEYAGGYTPLHLAARKGHCSVAEHLLNHGAEVNCMCTSELNEGYTSMHFASEAEMVKVLLSKGAGVDDVAQGYTPLHIAAKYGYSLVVEPLLKHGADVNCVCTSELSEGYTPVHFAVEKGCHEIVNLLLNAGANVNECANGYTPLHIATQKGYSQIAEILLKHGADFNLIVESKQNGGYTPIFLAVLNGHKEVASILLKYGSSVDDQDYTGKSILHLAVERRDLAMVELILQHSPDLNNESNRRSLISAVNGKKEECKSICGKLLQYGFTVSPNDVGNYDFLFHSIRNGYASILEQLIKCGAHINHLWCSNTFDQGYRPLHYAVTCMQLEVTELLLIYGADVNAQDESGRTSLHYAIRNGNLKIIRLLLSSIGNLKSYPDSMIFAVKMSNIDVIRVLLEYGVDVNFADEAGRTALHVIASYGNDMCHCPYSNINDNAKGEIAKLLLKHGAKVNIPCKSGYLPIHVAAKGGNVKVVEALLEYNADVNSICNVKVDVALLEYNSGVNPICNVGLTPIHFAALKGRDDVVNTLLNSGAVVEFMDGIGRTALHMACEAGHVDIVSTLLDHGYDVNTTHKDIQPLLDLAEEGFPTMIRSAVYTYVEDYNPRWSYRKISSILRSHLNKIVYFHDRKENIQLIDCHGFPIDYRSRCMVELGMLRNIKVSNTVFSLNDILAKSMHELALLLENENVSNFIETNICEEKFPLYASVIQGHFRIAEQRRKLLKDVNDYCLIIFGGLTWDCIQLVLSHLNNVDLCNLIHACRLPSVWCHVSSKKDDVV